MCRCVASSPVNAEEKEGETGKVEVVCVCEGSVVCYAVRMNMWKVEGGLWCSVCESEGRGCS